MIGPLDASPSRLEYASAFDRAACWLDSAQSPWLAVVSTPEFVDLTLARARRGMLLVCECERTARHARLRLESGGMPTAISDTSEVVLLRDWESPPRRLDSALWTSPQPASWQTALTRIGHSLSAEASLCVLVGRGVSRFSSRFRADWRAGEPAPVSARIRARLAADGWRVVSVLPLGGVRGIAWALAARAAAVAGRGDLADRAAAGYRASIHGGRAASFELLLMRREPSA